MRRRRSLIVQVAWVMIGIILFSTVGVAVLATRLSTNGVRDIAQLEMQDALAQAETLLREYHAGIWTREELQAQLNPAFRPGEWYVQLIDPDEELLGESEGATEWFAEHARNEQNIVVVESLGQQMVRSIAGIDLQNVYTQVITQDGEPLGSIHLGRRTAVMEAKSALLSQKIILLMLGLLGLFCVFLAMLARLVVIPSYRLAGASRAMAAGDFHVRADESVPGEMGYLSAVFNNMALELSRTFEELSYEKSSMVLVLEGLNDGVLAIDIHGEVIHRNAALRRQLQGRDKGFEDTIYAMLRTCLEDGQDRESTFWLGEDCMEVLVSAIFASGNGPLGAVALVRDVTTQQRLERTRHDYVANITHELRTPLATMRGLMEPMADGMVESEEDKQRYYHIILAEILRLSRLVNDLLELSGLQSGQKSFELEEVEVRSLLFETQERFHKAYAEKGVGWRVEAPEEDIFVRANEDRLSQVLTILVDNALKYTPAGGEAVLSASEPSYGVLRLSVRDTGVGISSEHLAHVFDRFYQADHSHSDRGNGLGLSIAQEVLDKMGFSLSAESEPGKGSCFSFDIPVPRREKE